MAYPVDPLGVRIRIAFGANPAADPSTWTWTDVTPYWHVPDDVTIGWGRTTGSEQAETSTLGITLKNTDNRFTPNDPRSPYWPNMIQWVPISYDIDLIDGNGWRNRFSGFIRSVELDWPGSSAQMSLARVQAVGKIGWESRGKPPSRSAMRRTIAASNPVAYWAVEDGVAAGQAASAIASHPPLTVAGNISFRAVDDITWTVFGNTNVVRPGTGQIADLSKGGTLFATLPAAVRAACATRWTAQVYAAVDATVTSGDEVILGLDTPGGTFVRWELIAKTTQVTQVVAYSPSGAATVVVTKAQGYPGINVWSMTVQQSGGNINAAFSTGATILNATGSVAGTLTGPSTVAVNPGRVTSSIDAPAGHVAIWAAYGAVPWSNDQFFDSYGQIISGADQSWQWEAATDRLNRLVTEDGLTLTMPAVPAWSVMRMGWQAAGTAIELRQKCEDADGGLLYEAGFGYGYLPRASRYNQAVALTIDAAQRQLGMPFRPATDDQSLRNRWEVSRDDGSSAVALDQASIALQGEIEGSPSLNLADDSTLADQAGWRLHLSTVKEPRYPAVSINLLTSPTLAAAWCACKPGSRVQVLNPPRQNRPGTVDQLVVGASETFSGRRGWKATLNVVPASPWDVATADAPQRVAADGSTLGSALGAAPTTLNTNPYFESNTAGWTAFGGAAARSTAQAHQGAASLLLTPDGVSATARVECDPVSGTASTAYQFVVWVRCAAARNVALTMNWFDAAVGYLSTAAGPTVAVAANTWTQLRMAATMPAGAAWVSANVQMDGTPPSSHTLYLDEATLQTGGTLQIASTAANGVWTTDPANFPLDINVGGERITLSGITGTTSPQTATVASRAVNGVSKAHTAGEPVDVWYPAIVPL